MEYQNTEFSQEELAILANAEYFRRRAAMEQKLEASFMTWQARMLEALKQGPPLPAGLGPTGARLYRGERHRGFPWRAMDLPASKSGENLFLFRAMVLYGHHFAIHLILSGSWLEHFLPLSEQSCTRLAGAGFLLNTSEDCWDWVAGADSGQVLMPEAVHNFAERNGFVRISRFLPVDQASEWVDAGLLAWEAVAAALLSPA